MIDFWNCKLIRLILFINIYIYNWNNVIYSYEVRIFLLKMLFKIIDKIIK